MKHLSIQDMYTSKPDFSLGLLPKDKLTLNWLVDWVQDAVSKNKVEFGDLIPSKKDLAKHLGISTGTVQNAIRYAEDLGYFKSKQCIGTMINNWNEAIKPSKMVSKKDKAVIEIKKFIVESGFKKNENLPSARIIAQEIETSSNTVRLALDYLVQLGMLRHKAILGSKSCWVLNKEIELNDSEKLAGKGIVAETLSKKLIVDIKNYIVENYKVGEKILPNSELAKHFQVSVRTINDAMKVLNKEKIVLSRRGQYGTIFLNSPVQLAKIKEQSEKSMFMSTTPKENLKQSYLYSWEKIAEQLKKYVLKNHEAGDKIPSMKELAGILNVSSNTIRRAISALCAQGFLHTQKGKYGGIYVVELPEKETAYQWLALNPKFIE